MTRLATEAESAKHASKAELEDTVLSMHRLQAELKKLKETETIAQGAANETMLAKHDLKEAEEKLTELQKGSVKRIIVGCQGTVGGFGCSGTGSTSRVVAMQNTYTHRI